MTPPSQVTLPPRLTSGRLARAFVDERWCSIHDSVDRERVHLLVTELVTNAVRHGGPPITVTIECINPVSLMLSVGDGSQDPPQAQEAEPTAVGGRGVQLVDLLSAEWGVEHHHHDGRHTHTETGPTAGEGKKVWCRMVA